MEMDNADRGEDGSGVDDVPHEITGVTFEGRGRTVLVPGLAYTVDMPLFYYLERAAIDAGDEVVLIRSDYRGDAGFRDSTPARRARRVADDIASVLRAADRPSSGASGPLTIVAKSVGTLGLADLVMRDELPGGRDVRLVWLTPLLFDDLVHQALLTTSLPSLMVCGTADPYYDVARVALLARRPSITVSIHPDADHSLDHDGSAAESIAALAAAIASAQAFAYAGRRPASQDTGGDG